MVEDKINVFQSGRDALIAAAGKDVIDFILATAMVAFAIGLVGIYYKVFAVKGGDQEWQKMKATDKYGAAFMTGMGALIGCFVVSLFFVQIGAYLSLGGFQGLLTFKVVLWMTVILSIIFLTVVAHMDPNMSTLAFIRFIWDPASWMLLYISLGGLFYTGILAAERRWIPMIIVFLCATIAFFLLKIWMVRQRKRQASYLS